MCEAYTVRLIEPQAVAVRTARRHVVAASHELCGRYRVRLRVIRKNAGDAAHSVGPCEHDGVGAKRLLLAAKR